jgi:hypothetical protein
MVWTLWQAVTTANPHQAGTEAAVDLSGCLEGMRTLVSSVSTALGFTTGVLSPTHLRKLTVLHLSYASFQLISKGWDEVNIQCATPTIMYIYILRGEIYYLLLSSYFPSLGVSCYVCRFCKKATVYSESDCSMHTFTNT